jgi:hypothetical protein
MVRMNSFGEERMFQRIKNKTKTKAICE